MVVVGKFMFYFVGNLFFKFVDVGDFFIIFFWCSGFWNFVVVFLVFCENVIVVDCFFFGGEFEEGFVVCWFEDGVEVFVFDEDFVFVVEVDVFYEIFCFNVVLSFYYVFLDSFVEVWEVDIVEDVVLVGVVVLGFEDEFFLFWGCFLWFYLLLVCVCVCSCFLGI